MPLSSDGDLTLLSCLFLAGFNLGSRWLCYALNWSLWDGKFSLRPLSSLDFILSLVRLVTKSYFSLLFAYYLRLKLVVAAIYVFPRLLRPSAFFSPLISPGLMEVDRFPNTVFESRFSRALMTSRGCFFSPEFRVVAWP